MGEGVSPLESLCHQATSFLDPPAHALGGDAKSERCDPDVDRVEGLVQVLSERPEKRLKEMEGDAVASPHFGMLQSRG